MRGSQFIMNRRKPIWLTWNQKQFQASKGYHTDHYLDKGNKGHKTDEHHRKEYEEAAGKKKKHHDNAGHKGSHEEEAFGHRGAQFDEKKGHKKGHKTKGMHSTHYVYTYKNINLVCACFENLPLELKFS